MSKLLDVLIVLKFLHPESILKVAQNARHTPPFNISYDVLKA